MTVSGFREALAKIKSGAVAKDEPGVDAVHIPSAGGNGKRRARNFRQTMADASKHVADMPGRSGAIKGAWTLAVPITKTDEAQNLVFGWASIIEEDGKPIVDSQGDVVSEADLEKAFYGFAEDARVAGEMHGDTGEHVGKMVECMVFTREKQKALGIDLKKSGAWVGFRLAPALFAKVRSGEYPAFSIGGSGRRVAL